MEFCKFAMVDKVGNGKKNKGKPTPSVGRTLEHNCRTSDLEHPDRKRGNDNINSAKTCDNYDLADELRNGKSAQQYFAEKFKAAKEDYQQKEGKELRKDAVTMCGWVVTVPKDLPPEKHEQFFKSAFEFMCDRYGKDNVIAANVHLDETTPHLHFCFMPLVEDKKYGGTKLCAKNLETPTKLKQINKDITKYLEDELQCPVHILNGATAGGNKSIAELKAEQLQEQNRLEQERNRQLQERHEQLADENVVLESENDDLQDSLKKIQSEIDTLVVMKAEIPPRPVLPPKPVEPVKQGFMDKEFKSKKEQYDTDLEAYRKAEQAQADWDNQYQLTDRVQQVATQQEAVSKQLEARQRSLEAREQSYRHQQATLSQRESNLNERQKRLTEDESVLTERIKSQDIADLVNARTLTDELLRTAGYDTDTAHPEIERAVLTLKAQQQQQSNHKQQGVSR
jgi:hypothetical protein